MKQPQQIDNELKENGYTIVRDVISEDVLTGCRQEIEKIIEENDFRGGFRRATELSDILKTIAECKEIESLKKRLGYPEAFLVRSIVFDKTPNSNWKVAWHQDTKIPVKSRFDVAGYSGWSIKDGIVHTQPPVSVMESMITIRLHLDHTPAEAGALRVVPKSHKQGFIQPEIIKELTKNETTCECRAGDALIMHPLILHASSPAVNPSHRRVLHLEFASTPIESPLEWCTAE
ncbi:phytanoyl-CoA dioxygenase family protein [Rubellicoccus peritrichatus]|uniref:Phytanoyl-CoA dioxygenase family protein n=1 Tax=Rubellicoccus peritrichatus TaxID=3080537 RepID=A0AAQ3QY11_9BACT|nr:phytanoyl-CoA dioxygenase family protein [Puniceicoccus sp. CR14]WOO43350.1 phytanoyl-CoA dioxygenase family protein [Puniceicoccus sp. CR14]